jgi:hypothetical protein
LVHSYPSIFALGHRAVVDLLKSPVIVEEKVDGSQFSFQVTEDGEFQCRSKGQQIDVHAPEKMFAAGVSAVKEALPTLHPGYTYRGEYLQKPKHNALTYNRVPKNHIILFDINSGLETYLAREEKVAEAQRIGFEFVPLLAQGQLTFVDVEKLLGQESVLGGPEMEGVVVKPTAYDLFGVDKKLLLAKFVSDKFKEVHTKEWKTSNPSSGDILVRLTETYRSDARWQKAVQHSRDAGLLVGEMRDLAILVPAVGKDIAKECEDDIKEALYKWAWPHISRGVLAGFPEWYKRQLVVDESVVNV